MKTFERFVTLWLHSHTRCGKETLASMAEVGGVFADPALHLWIRFYARPKRWLWFLWDSGLQFVHITLGKFATKNRPICNYMIWAVLSNYDATVHMISYPTFWMRILCAFSMSDMFLNWLKGLHFHGNLYIYINIYIYLLDHNTTSNWEWHRDQMQSISKLPMSNGTIRHGAWVINSFDIEYVTRRAYNKSKHNSNTHVLISLKSFVVFSAAQSQETSCSPLPLLKISK